MSAAHWAIAATLATAFTHAAMRWVDLHPFLVAFWRNLFCLIIIMPVVVQSAAWQRRPGALPRHIARGVINGTAMILMIMGLVRIPFAEAIALTFAAPAFVVIGGMLWLRERPDPMHLFGAVLGFAGVLIIAPPGPGWLSGGGAMILLSAALFAGSLLIAREQTRFAHNTSILFYLYLLLTTFCAPLAATVWEMPKFDAFLALMLVACCSVAAHAAATMAVRLAQASRIALFDYLRLIWAALIGWLIFDEAVSTQVVAGGLVIFVAALLPFSRRG